MKPSRTRIFIISKNTKQNQPTPLPKIQTVPQGSEERRQRAKSKRRSMFVQMASGPSQERQEKYQFNLQNHIHAQSFGTVLNCDLLGKVTQAQNIEKKQRDLQKQPKPPLHAQNPVKNEATPIKEESHDRRKESIGNDKNNEEMHESPHDNTFSNHRLKIFDQNFRPNAYLSSVSTKRRNLFIRHESHLNRLLSLNNSISRQRRRIFSFDTNNKPILHSFQPIPSPPPPPLQATIKEQDQSNIVSIIRQQIHRSLPRTIQH